MEFEQLMELAKQHMALLKASKVTVERVASTMPESEALTKYLELQAPGNQCLNDLIAVGERYMAGIEKTYQLSVEK
ncbi:MAG: hypothetical protein V1837_06125 [Candidatus Woesearchaeota archaeon]